MAWVLVPGQPTPGCACAQAAVDGQVGDDDWARCWTVTGPPSPLPLGSRLGLRGLLSGCVPTLGSQVRDPPPLRRVASGLKGQGGLSRPEILPES